MLRILPALLIAFALSFSTVSGQNTEKGEKYLKKGQRQMKRYEYYKAIPYFVEAVNFDLQNPIFNFYAGKAYMLVDEPLKAIPFLQRTAEVDPYVDDNFYWYYARALHFAGMFEDALVAYEIDLSNQEAGTPEYESTNLGILQAENGVRLQDKIVDYKIENAGPFVNSRWPEYAATFSNEFQQMVFTSRRPRKVKQKANALYHKEDVMEEVYTARLNKDTWAEVDMISNSINIGGHDASISIAEDGESMIFYTHKDSGDIFISRKIDGEWSKRESISENVNTDSHEPSAFISADGEWLLYVSDKKGGFGKKDLYISRRSGSDWEEGINLGENINSEWDEDSPWLSEDGKTLYFSSRGHTSIGGYDIFKSELQSDGSWSKPVNLGIPINSPGDDIYFVKLKGTDKFYFSSFRNGGYGDMDIYVGMPYTSEKEECISDTVYITETIEKEEETGEANVVTGRVIDGITKEPLGAIIELIDPSTQEIVTTTSTNPQTGTYYVPVTSGKSYLVKVTSKSYISHYEEMGVSATGDVSGHQREFAMQRTSEDGRIVLGWQFFDYNSSNVKREYTKELDDLISVMKQVPGLTIRVVGHTDDRGSDSYNLKLSLQRAESVKAYMIKQGVDAERIEVQGKGELEPIYTEPENQKFNRRVEIFINN